MGKTTNLDTINASLDRLDRKAEQCPALVDPAARGDANVRGWERDLEGDEVRKKTETVQVGFRLPVDLLARVDRYAEKVTASTGGIATASRTDVVCALLTRALDEIEKDEDGGTP